MFGKSYAAWRDFEAQLRDLAETMAQPKYDVWQQPATHTPTPTEEIKRLFLERAYAWQDYVAAGSLIDITPGKRPKSNFQPGGQHYDVGGEFVRSKAPRTFHVDGATITGAYFDEASDLGDIWKGFDFD